ncbi:MAG: ABC transporter ATP-binding protein [Clostridia bacterium]|nr:ABC transporter ATP-binding protein [Clostridia bacterium]
MNKTNTRPFVKQFYKGNKGLLVFMICVSLLTSVGNLAVAWLIQQITDLVGGNDTGYTITEIALVTACLIAGTAFAYFIIYHTKPKFVARGIAQYKEYIFGILAEKKISAFSNESSSLYVSALTNDIAAVEKGYLLNIFVITECVPTLIGAIIMMIWYSPMLTLIAVLLSFMPVLAAILTGGRASAAEKMVSDTNQKYTASLKDFIGGFTVVKSFKAETQMCRMFTENVQSLAKAKCKKDKILVLVEMFAAIAGLIAQLGVFLAGAYLALSGKGVTAGTVMVFVQMMNYIISPVSVIPTCLAEYNSARALVEKISAALAENRPDQGKETVNALKKGITLKSLTFGYEPEKTVLNNLNITFEAGKKYAVVGTSGSGKSTLLNLLMASYHNYDGGIYYDDTELNCINSDALYDMQSIVQQNVFVFNASLKDNITMFGDFSESEVDNAIQLSGLSPLVQEKGKNYICGENGCFLSGGEKQRVSIARSLLKKASVLLVDEATASLDAETAFQVSSSILGLEGITCITVTHDLDESLLKQYDSIITLKNGTLKEQGSFDTLISQKGYFYSLYTVSQ